MADITEEIEFKWDPRRDTLAQILEVVARVSKLPPGARVRELVVVVEHPVPSQLPRGQHGG